jgi:hypothetical protein
MSVADQVTQASPLAAIFERYHVGWETRNPDMIASDAERGDRRARTMMCAQVRPRG